VTVLGAVFLLMWWTGRAEDPHGMVFVFLGGALVFPLGVALIVAALLLRLRNPIRWLGQLLPLLWPVTYAVLLKSFLLP
jgi:hypothetical protein